MQENTNTDVKADLDEQLHLIVDRMLAPFGKSSPRGGATILESGGGFDTSKPNQHDSKAEFQRELDAVEGSLQHIFKAIQKLAPRETDGENREMLDRLRLIIDQKFRSTKSRGAIEDTIELVRKNVADVGGFTASILIMLDFWVTLSDRLAELKDQEEKFWNLSHRAPDYYARAIALRLAKLYAKETRQRPTIGTSGVTADPSTSYSRALSEMFDLLEIMANVRSPAEWAVGQLSEEDLNPPVNALRYGLLSPSPHAKERNVLDVVDALMKKGGEK